MRINISFMGLLAIVFITLKLLDVIMWSWIWVLSPIWITAIIPLIIICIWVLIVFIRGSM